jgi:SNF2 family DNA or RNA helicase
MIRVRVKKLERRALMPQQADYLNWVITNRVFHPACFMEMRLGKTLANIRLIQHWKCDKACIVVAPTSVLEAWERELTAEGELYIIGHGLSGKERIEAAQEAVNMGCRVWFLINYECIRLSPEISLLPWFACLLDESTKIKDGAAQVSKVCSIGFRDTKHRIIISGLPAPEGDLNLFNQFMFLHGDCLGIRNYYQFRSNYFEPNGPYGEWTYKEGMQDTVREQIYRKAFVLRRADVNLPNIKIRETRYVKLDKDARKLYKKIEDEWSVWIKQEDGETEKLLETEYAVVKKTWCCRIAGGSDPEGVFKWHHKTKELISLLKGELKNQPVVVWFRFNSEIHAIEKILKEAGIPCTSLTGDTKREERFKRNEWFRNSRHSGKVLLCQTMLAQFGLDFSVADTAIYYSFVESNEAIAQSEDRIYHPKKTTPLLYIYLLTENTVDEDVYSAISDGVVSAKMFMMKMLTNFFKRRGTNG